MSLLEILLNPRFVRGVLWFLAAATPAAGAILAVSAKRRVAHDPGKRGKDLTRNPLFWVLSASGPLLGILWIVFNAIENALGLDSIAGYLINTALFCLVGFGLSLFLWYGRYWLHPRRRHTAPVTKQP